MDQNMIYLIAGVAAALLILITVILFLRKRKNKKTGKTRKARNKHNFVSKYNVREATDEELNGVVKLELVNYKNGLNTLVLRIKVRGGTIKLDDIEPYDNDWGFVHNYSELIGQKRHADQSLRLFFNRREKKSTNYPEKFEINIVYRDDSNTQWVQPFSYNSEKGIKIKPAMLLAT